MNHSKTGLIVFMIIAVIVLYVIRSGKAAKVSSVLSNPIKPPTTPNASTPATGNAGSHGTGADGIIGGGGGSFKPFKPGMTLPGMGPSRTEPTTAIPGAETMRPPAYQDPWSWLKNIPAWLNPFGGGTDNPFSKKNTTDYNPIRPNNPGEDYA